MKFLKIWQRSYSLLAFLAFNLSEKFESCPIHTIWFSLKILRVDLYCSSDRASPIRSKNCISLRGLKIFFTFYRCEGVSRAVDPYGPYGWNSPFSIRIRSENCISLRGLKKYIRRLTGVKGVSRVVDPYGPYGWNRPFSIRTRSENCISLRGLRIYSTSYWSEGGFTGCRSVRSVQME